MLLFKLMVFGTSYTVSQRTAGQKQLPLGLGPKTWTKMNLRSHVLIAVLHHAYFKHSIVGFITLQCCVLLDILFVTL